MSEATIDQFKLQAALRQSTDFIVELAEKTMDKEMVAKIGVDMNSQLSNLLAVTKAAPSSRVVKNWVRYQAGRERDKAAKAKNKWERASRERWKSQDIKKAEQSYKKTLTYKWRDTELEQNMEEDVAKLEKRAEQLASKHGIKQGEIIMLLLAQYAGYLRRSYVGNGGGEK